ncbi:MAG TPA: AtpZ/AtpI family protein [Paenirhodobacter sp.]
MRRRGQNVNHTVEYRFLPESRPVTAALRREFVKHMFFNVLPGQLRALTELTHVAVTTIRVQNYRGVVLMTERPSEEPDPGRLKALEDRLAQRRKAEAKPVQTKGDSFRQLDTAWRMVIELVSGLGIGFGIGFGLDVALNTRPWFMLVFTLLGFVAGVRVMLRTATEMNKTAAVAEATDKEGK